MNEEILETIKQLEIKKAPEEQSLESANQSYTKDQLAHFIERHELSIAKSWKKAEIVTALTDWMNETQTNYLQSNEDLHSFYSKNLIQNEQPIALYDSNLSDNDLTHILHLIEHGLAYNVDGQLWVPDETAKTFTDSSETHDLVPNKKDSDGKVMNEKTDSQAEPVSENASQSNSVTEGSPALSASRSSDKSIAQVKQQRLDYLKKQSKKKKRKKRK